MTQSEIAVDDELSVRRLTTADAEALYTLVIANRAYLARFMPWCGPSYSVEDTRKFVADGAAPEHLENTLAGGIYYRNALAGTVGLRGLKSLERGGEIGYWIAEPMQGRGIVTRCCRKLIGDAFSDHGLNRVQLRAATDNTRSRAIAVRLGMTHEGTQREAGRDGDGRFHDLELYSVLAREWRQQAVRSG
jgi:ribosomal-protein-serine acetyltransferase